MSTFWTRVNLKLVNHSRLIKSATGSLFAAILFATFSNASNTGLCERDSPNYSNKTMSVKLPSAFVPHGGGPLPILGDKQHVELVKWLGKFVDSYLTGDMKPTSVLVISAHWEEKQTTVQSGETTELYYDYYGFPDESYNLNYNLLGAAALSKRIQELLTSSNIPFKVDGKRGYDHGVFIPMKVIYPEGNIPTVQLSLVTGLDPKTHIKLGEALAPLRKEGVFILGSGMSYHNMRGFNRAQSNQDSDPFHEYLRTSLVKSSKYEDRVSALEKWAKAPKGRECHPREEHLIPLHVLVGTTKDDEDSKVSEAFYANVAGVKCAGYVFQ